MSKMSTWLTKETFCSIVISMNTKICRKCNEEKSVSEFNKQKSSKDGYGSYCKPCNKIYHKARYKRNPDVYKEKVKKWRKRNPIKSKKRGEMYRNSKAIYTTHIQQLTTDEEPRLAKDGISLEVRCIYCGRYHIPRTQDVVSRVRALSMMDKGSHHLYCSEGCKHSCPIYHQKLYPKDHKPTTGREVQPQLRKMVLERDNWTCQKCGRTDTLHCHHIDPVKLNPIESADIDNCITLCVDCHKEAHDQDGCRTGQLANC